MPVAPRNLSITLQSCVRLVSNVIPLKWSVHVRLACTVALLLCEFFLQTLSMKTTDSKRQGLRERNDHADAAMVSA